MRQSFVLVQLIAIVLLYIFNFQSYDNFTLVSNILFTMEVSHTQQRRPQTVFDNYIFMLKIFMPKLISDGSVISDEMKIVKLG